MCERTCPKCGSSEHVEYYGVAGLTIVCDCGVTLAHRRDIEAAPTNLTEGEAEQWQAEGTFVLPGAEARDPSDDALYRSHIHSSQAGDQ